MKYEGINNEGRKNKERQSVRTNFSKEFADKFDEIDRLTEKAYTNKLLKLT